jgi:hypothetical protein
MGDALTWLQGWYAAHTNGDWEHEYGIEISTLDNPGWRVAIDLDDTDLEARDFERKDLHRSEHDWLVIWVDDRKWQLACGPLNLAEGLDAFRAWAGDISAR